MSTVEPVAALLVDDSSQQRLGWRMVLEAHPDIEVVAEAPDGARALALARRMPLDVVVMDVRMPRVGGLAAAERIRTDAQVREQGGPPGIVLMTALDLEDFVGPSAEVGADALLYKDVEPEALLAAVLAAATTGRARA
ncbi:MAG: response regulator transcription factor [Microcella pacifica]|jgi:DNA-binding NarL/FixJ family response regulator|uniref:Response regulator transcription factor n=1 Tax=Microcella pacifica TaxID=2591847 RepID=A0A9E5JKX8_9MICO|nr:response regulator transcription factor [Microcella pacifica]NHF62279.1 response regulator transcription factor [Microcella pacifica]